MSAASVLSPRTLDRARIGDQIFADLKQEIVSGQLRRGDKLPTVKALSVLYGVSEPTVREALRGLSVCGLVDVRHGSGAYVDADGGSLVAMSLGAVIQLEMIGVADALDLLRVLNDHAASRATAMATDAELHRLRVAAELLPNVTSVDEAASAVRAFHSALAAAAHNPLLEVICAFLSDVQAKIAAEVADGSIDTWAAMFVALHPLRMRFVEAIESRDAQAASTLAKEFHVEAARLMTSMPKAREVRLSDPQLGGMLSSIVSNMAQASRKPARPGPEWVGRTGEKTS